MRYVCDAPSGKTWFQIETEAEAALESALMGHAVEKLFRQAREHAKTSYVPPSGSYIEQNIGLKAHLQRVMPVFLTLRDQDGNGLATAMLPPTSYGLLGFGNSHPCLAAVHGLDGPLRFDRRSMGEDGTAVSGQAGRSRTQRQGQPLVCRSRAVDCSHRQSVA